ncbi:hypothetical protein BDZ91DRAFT_783145 [Kalaharituber pfeilii]|nr:hypothetical protein BDZ91DRAFT_783145 [Kalaharituber pfeilii]
MPLFAIIAFLRMIQLHPLGKFALCFESKFIPGGMPKIGIVGAGMAGLYAAFELRRREIDYHIYELDSRVGGRILTRRFTGDAHQYYEAGAMRIPQTTLHRPVMNLIKELNDKHDAKLKVIDYILISADNLIFVNGRYGSFSASEEQTAEALGFTNVPKEYKDKTAPDLLTKVLEGWVRKYKDDPVKGWQEILKYDRYSFRSYLQDVERWDPSVIEFVETMCSQSNQYALSFPEMVMQFMDFDEKQWKTLDDGMDRLPQTLAKVVGLKNISFNARVQRIVEESNGKITIHADRTGHQVKGTYDKIILAIPPSAVRMIPERPRWSAAKEQALRSMHFENLYKIGLRFKTRWWELVDQPCRGGQSTTDLPIRWIVYPSYGIGEDGPGVLLLYSWMTDAGTWTSVTFDQRVNACLTHLSQVYSDSNINIFDEFIAADDQPWANRNPTGDAMFLPGQFSLFFEEARENEGNIYFAGEHLSRHHTWIAGALDSANYTVQKILKDLAEWKDLQPNDRFEKGFLPVIGFPKARPVNPEDERKKALRELVDKYLSKEGGRS